MSVTVTLAIVGAGGRGTSYAAWVGQHRERARVVAVADPNPPRRDPIALEHGIAPERVYADWRALLADGKVADAVVICTQDEMHREPALAFLAAGYDVLLEKPMSPHEAECVEIAAAAEASGAIFGVCHVLRYTPYTELLMGLLAADAIGEPVSIQHLEPVGWYHQAHSFVRGNWGREADSSPMLLAKSCHDLDWLEHVMGSPIVAQSSFGGLHHFRPDQAPQGAAFRCLDCALAETCAYSATRIYLDQAREGDFSWPVDTMTTDHTVAGVEAALREGPYGRCVYRCDNDVVDHQVIAMQFASGATGVFTMTAFTEMGHRKTRIFGTQGRLEGDGETIEVFDFRTGEATTHRVDVSGADAGSGHGGGDAGLMAAFVAAVASRDQSLVPSSAAATLSSHQAVFAAERARRTGQVARRPA